MFKKLGSFMRMGASDDDSSSPAERFGQVQIARRYGEEILRATAARRNHVQGIRDHLTSMTREEKDELVDRMFARLALFVYDLPASEKSHHRERFGLFDHLLEVAHHTARELGSPGFQISPEPSVNHRERPLWIYAGVVAAVAHDIGKPLDLEVVVPGRGTKWDPTTEPLRHFCLRNQLGETGPGIWHYRPGRGTDSHERSIAVLLPVVLMAEVERYLGPRLESVVAALTSGQDFKTANGLSQPAKDVVRAVRRADQASARNHHSTDALKEEVPLSSGGGAQPAPSAMPKRASVPTRPALIPGPSNPSVMRKSKEEEPVFVPSDFWVERMPDPSERRGDPVETERRLAAELDPPRFLDTLRRMIVAYRFSRNNLYTDVYVRPDYIWLLLPRALRRFALINHLPFDTEILKRMLAALGSSPLVDPSDDRRVPVYMKPRSDANTFEAIRIKTQGFITKADQARLGFHSYDIRAIDPMTFAEAASG